MLNEFSVRRNKEVVSLFLISAVVLFAYWPIFFGFFQQDEWLSFAHHSVLQKTGITALLKDALIPSQGHYQPPNTLIIHILYSVFGLNYLAYAIVSVVFHLINVILIFYLSKIIIKDFKLSVISALLFGISAVSYQATSWPLSDVGVHLATMLAVMSLIYTFKFVFDKKNKYFYYSLIFLIGSLLFKEIALGLFLLFPLIYFLYGIGGIKEYRKKITIVIVLGLTYVLFRGVIIFMPQAYTNNNSVVRFQSLQNLVYNIATFPIKGVVQSIIPADVLVKTAYLVADNLPDEITGEKSTPDYDIFVQKKVLETITFTIFSIIVLLAAYSYVRGGSSAYKKNILFSLIFIIVNTPIFALSPERTGIIFIIDSRNLYFVMVGTSILIISLLNNLRLKSFIVLSCLVMLCIGNVFLLRNILVDITKVGFFRKDILSQIIHEHPSLPQRVVFYTESDSSFYGLSETTRILPFQSGFGQVLLVYYYPTGIIPVEFLSNRFLWDITSQGYKEVNGIGFGYFRDFDQLRQVVVEDSLNSDSVIAYSYDSNLQKISDISEDIKNRLRSFKSKKEILDRRLYTVSSDFNPKDLPLLNDGNRETVWSSNLPYIEPQSLQINLNSANLCKITLDSFKNEDQNKVGYRVLASNNNVDFHEIFTSKLYPPNAEGIVDFYFKPQSVRFLKIQQQGNHKFANWVISEISLYQCVDSEGK